ncbi:Protein phosphatase PTC7 [Biomphalaria glabrata]|uniref:Protein phosphatase n=2 Tax=Biomphalaria TaxID=6525 RepID=A0A9W2YG19_BIOGL|nr:protein phosphatase PTC7 homolog [Biomphalaria glabrata]KAI8753255.1 protein phosphatase PTC7-like protein [Biomphalaria glabrata]KAK0068898.1 protein phosphatase PTC7 [Biomphalaria pfeifferi]
MQSVAQYGKFVVRAIAAGIHNEFQLKSPFDKAKEPLHLVTGTSGFSKSVSKSNQFSKWTFGDDAYFISRNKVADVLGVADGVGGWRNYGIDPSSFPRSLMMACERMVRTGHFVPQSPANIIAAGYSEMLEQKVLTLGSSTACVVSLHREERTIYSANLGDSGFLVVRDGEIVHRSTEQQHYFNTPYQLAMAPPSGDGLWLSDSPDVAETSSFKVQDGDILMLATDGLFDNLSEDMIVRTLESLHSTKEEEKIQSAACSIAEHAYKLSLDPDYMSPFALSACDIGIDLRGGKPDDITCIVARVTHQSDIFL